MSARGLLGAAVAKALTGIDGLAVFDAPPVRAAVPYAVVGEAELKVADAAGIVAREVRLAVEMFDAGERPVRLRGLLETVEERVTGLAGELGGGWRVRSMVLSRSRVMRAGDTRWRGMSEFVGLVWRVDG